MFNWANFAGINQGKTGCWLALLLLFLVSDSVLYGADFSDPDWPCIQRRVDQLSYGQMWPELIERQDLSPEQAAKIDDLIAHLSLRRTSMEENKISVDAFAREASNHDLTLVDQIFIRVFDDLNKRRNRLVGGIVRYARKQAGLAKKIEATRAKMAALESENKPDFDEIDRLEAELDWDERIYQDRAKSLTYICETPVLIQKRIFAIARLLQAVAVE